MKEAASGKRNHRMGTAGLCAAYLLAMRALPRTEPRQVGTSAVGVGEEECGRGTARGVGLLGGKVRIF